MTQCACKTKAGKRCTKATKTGSKYCSLHKACSSQATQAVQAVQAVQVKQVKEAKKQVVVAKQQIVEAKKQLKDAIKLVKKVSTKPARGCVEQSNLKKYITRPSPAFPANECCGMVMKGNDGRTYKSIAASNGVCRWVSQSK